jgi:hypothetical protein
VLKGRVGRLLWGRGKSLEYDSVMSYSSLVGMGGWKGLLYWKGFGRVKRSTI